MGPIIYLYSHIGDTFIEQNDSPDFEQISAKLLIRRIFTCQLPMHNLVAWYSRGGAGSLRTRSFQVLTFADTGVCIQFYVSAFLPRSLRTPASATCRGGFQAFNNFLVTFQPTKWVSPSLVPPASHSHECRKWFWFMTISPIVLVDFCPLLFGLYPALH